ncbi:MAG: hypothetical protein R3344_12850, partial [Acidobacteriota bacterium]|nr:hypothetical protein [Acidobacteriota bacterium]
SHAAELLRGGFRHWLGPGQRIAVDPETGHEYRWEDVVAFDTGIDDEDRRRLLSAIRDTSFLREAIFLFSVGATVRLSDIPPGGVSVRLLGSRSGKSVYRITVQTRHQETHEIAANVNHDLTPQQIRDEVQWLILCGEPRGDRDPVVEDYGGYWEEQDLWSEEFIAGENLERALRRLTRQTDDEDRTRQTWLYFAWSAMSTFVDFWDRTGRLWELSDPSPSAVIVPGFDYQVGARLVSVSARHPFSGLMSMIRSFRTRFVEPVEKDYPVLEGIVGWDVIFSAVLEVVGEDDGLAMFREALAAEGEDIPGELRDALESYLAAVEKRGFLPMRLFFAAQRYRRWARLSTDATRLARARTMQELYDTYGLQRLISRYPETRVRFFRESVFHEGEPQLVEGLEEIITRMRVGELVGDDLSGQIGDLRAHVRLEEDDDYFLARLSFPHLRPEDAAGYVHSDFGGRHQSEMVVKLEDAEGRPFIVRHALNP